MRTKRIYEQLHRGKVGIELFVARDQRRPKGGPPGYGLNFRGCYPLRIFGHIEEYVPPYFQKKSVCTADPL